VVGSAARRGRCRLAGGDLGVGQGAVGRLRLRRRVDEGERDFIAGEYDFVPEPAGIDLRHARDGFDRADAGRRVNVADAPFGGLRVLGGAGPGHDARSKEETLHALPLYNAVRRNRNALPTTLTDDSAIAAAAMIGDSKMPKVG